MPRSASPPRLPLGIRDYLPPGTTFRRRIADACLAAMETWGYRRIITPLFEYAEVLARGASGPSDAALRLVEPATGEVLSLRTDITPQVARVIATRYAAEIGPLRLCYEGSVIRLGRAEREVLQAGAELVLQVGASREASAAADVEAVRLCDATLRAAGVGRVRFDLGHPRFVRACLAAVPARLRPAVEEALDHKDAAGVARVLDGARLPARVVALVGALPSLWGGPEQLAEARRLVARARMPAAAAALSEVEALARVVGDEVELGVDLGERRGFDYYTGVRFSAYAPGAGDAIARGGRYDELGARYGRPVRAIGFAIEVESVALALRARGTDERDEPRGLLVVGEPGAASGEAARLRRDGERAAAALGLSARQAEAYAARWGFRAVVHVGPVRRAKAARPVEKARRVATERPARRG